MQSAKLVKVAIVAAVSLWLAGCASTANNSVATPTETTQTADTTEVMTVTDPAVRAVLRSGKVDATPEQISEMLDKQTFLFGYNQDFLQASDYGPLDVHAIYLNSPEGLDKKLVIQGHTDERGTRSYNLGLGERRANTVKNYLAAQGVDPSRIEVISFGFEKPLDPAHNEAAWEKNRRAVVIVE